MRQMDVDLSIDFCESEVRRPKTHANDNNNAPSSVMMMTPTTTICPCELRLSSFTQDMRMKAPLIAANDND